MRSLVMLLALVALTQASDISLCNPIQIESISKCYVTYMAGFNITMAKKKIPEYWKFHDTRMDWLNREGTNAQPEICDLGNALISCLKPYSCMSAADYEFLGAANLTESNDYWIDINLTGYQCGAGYSILMDNFYCIGTARDQHEADLDKCTAAVERNIAIHGPCKAEQILLNCQSDVFNKACGWNAGVFFCNNVLVGVNAVDPQCYKEGKVSCPNPRATLMDAVKSRALKF